MPRTDILNKVLAALSAGALDDLRALVTDDFTMMTLPSSLGRPPIGKDQLAALLGGLDAIFEKGAVKFTINTVFEAKESNTLIVQAQSSATSKQGTPYNNEYVFIVELTPEEDKVKRFTEFVDSKFLDGFVAAEAAKAQAGAA